MKITWLGHSGFRLEIEGASILIDPWMTGNPMFPEDRRAEAIAGATHVLVTHGHGDHTGDAVALARDLGIPVAGIFDLVSFWEKREGIEVIGFNKGGTVDLGAVLRNALDRIGSAGGHANMAGAQVPMGIISDVDEAESLTDVVHDLVAGRFFGALDATTGTTAYMINPPLGGQEK